MELEDVEDDDLCRTSGANWYGGDTREEPLRQSGHTVDTVGDGKQDETRRSFPVHRNSHHRTSNLAFIDTMAVPGQIPDHDRF